MYTAHTRVHMGTSKCLFYIMSSGHLVLITTPTGFRTRGGRGEGGGNNHKIPRSHLTHPPTFAGGRCALCVTHEAGFPSSLLCAKAAS